MPGQNHKIFFLLMMSFTYVNNLFAKNVPLQYGEGFAYSIAKSKGVLLFKTAGAKCTFNFYNKDGSVWKRMTYDGDYINTPDFVHPYIVRYNPCEMVLDCRVIKSGYYEVSLNDKGTLIKYIRIDDPHFKFQSWQKLIVNDSREVDFNAGITPLKQLPLSNSRTIAKITDEKYYPIKIKGNWLQLKYWGDTKYDYCWIQWQKNSCIMIQPMADQ